MMPIASSAVGWPAPSVPHTVMPRSAAYSRSIEALRMPEVSSSFRSGSCSSVGLRNGVRSRIMQMIEKPLSAATAAFGLANGSLNTLISTSGIDQSASEVATFW